MKIQGLEELNAKLHQLRDEVGNKDAGGALYSSLMLRSVR